MSKTYITNSKMSKTYITIPKMSKIIIIQAQMSKNYITNTKMSKILITNDNVQTFLVINMYFSHLGFLVLDFFVIMSNFVIQTFQFQRQCFLDVLVKHRFLKQQKFCSVPREFWLKWKNNLQFASSTSQLVFLSSKKPFNSKQLS